MGADSFRVHGRFLLLHGGSGIRRYRGVDIQWIHSSRHAVGNETLPCRGGDCGRDLTLLGYHQPLPRNPEDPEQPAEQLDFLDHKLGSGCVWMEEKDLTL